MTNSQVLRPELTEPPMRMKDLPIDRGYPVPWFVPWVPGEDGALYPEFRAADRPKFVLAVRRRLCWVCGQRLGSYLAFVIGPMCGITRVTSEPPCHLECATWSAMNCPFLSRPTMVRRDLAADHPEAIQPAGHHIDRNPGVTLLWVCRDYTLFESGNGPLITVGDPERVSFWAEGRVATRSEIDESIRTGLPFLEASDPRPEALAHLQGLIAKFQRLLPEA